MEQEWKLERLISAGLRIEFGDYSTTEEWLYKVYVALAPFPAQRHKLALACSDSDAAPAEKIRLGLEILSEALDDSRLLSSDQHGVPRPPNESPESLGQFQL